MATSDKQTILIVHGGWHVPESYAKLTAALESSGFEVHIPHLPSVDNVRPPTADLSSDTSVIREAAERLVNEGRTVVALLHSYGGQVVFKDTFMMDKVEEFGNMDLVPLAFDIPKDNSCVSRDPRTLIVTPKPEDDMVEVDKYISTFKHWNAQCMYQPIQYTAWAEIPASLIYTTNDMTAPINYQKSFVEDLEKKGLKVQTFELETGHCPNFTATEEVVDTVKKAVFG